jgi:hypothetical protein
MILRVLSSRPGTKSFHNVRVEQSTSTARHLAVVSERDLVWLYLGRVQLPFRLCMACIVGHARG